MLHDDDDDGSDTWKGATTKYHKHNINDSSGVFEYLLINFNGLKLQGDYQNTQLRHIRPSMKLLFYWGIQFHI